MKMRIVGLLLVAVAVCGAIAFGLYRRDIAEIRAQVRKGSELAATSAGVIEYASRGEGPAVLAVHGAGGGYDQGLLIAASFLGDGFKVIARRASAICARRRPATPRPRRKPMPMRPS